MRPLRADSLGWGIAMIAAALLSLGRPAAGQVASDAQVKAAYLHKFPGFVEWPADSFATPGAPILIGVLDAEAVYDELSRQVSGRMVKGRSVEIRRVHDAASLPTVHVLYIGSEAHRDAAAVLAQVSNRPVLTVTNTKAGLAPGAVLNLVEIGGRIRVEASLPAAANNRLKLSSRLLGVASRVVEATP